MYRTNDVVKYSTLKPFDDAAASIREIILEFNLLVKLNLLFTHSRCLYNFSNIYLIISEIDLLLTNDKLLKKYSKLRWDRVRMNFIKQHLYDIDLICDIAHWYLNTEGSGIFY